MDQRACRSKHKFLKSTRDNNEQSEKLDDQKQKLSSALDLCKQITNTISMRSQQNFDLKLNQLKSLNEAWSGRKEFGFQVFEQVLDASTYNNVIEPS